ncbi:CoA-transferase [Pigmentiphaga sp.]|uniref:CoA-transferase n=1 Tax=Pigmentiphaga sp. TaxID=1977564 RepID=UPI0025D48588|nr:CoA-transferase [Pigmentiphaga sp.]
MTCDWNVLAVTTLARLLAPRGHVLVGTNAAAQMAGALLARELSGGRIRVSVIGSRKHSFLTDDLSEIFDCAARGRFDAFMIGGGQIDGQANINLVGVGQHPRMQVRWSGSHGTPLLYLMIPNIIIFRERHTREVMVDKVDFISTPGTSPAEVYRPGGPTGMLTGKGVFSFDKRTARFRLESLHPGTDLRDILQNTGFAFDHDEAPPATALPSNEVATLLRDAVCPEVAEIYPRFAQALSRGVDTHLAHASS